ncbi:MAG: hypothetical protein K6G15_04185 [Desulfovibrio sp.]|nr:hypothetical protein [Desulfovibrio sp.]
MSKIALHARYEAGIDTETLLAVFGQDDDVATGPHVLQSKIHGQIEIYLKDLMK